MNRPPAALSPQTWEAVQRPTAEARGLPNQAYTDRDFARYERDTLLASTWTCVGLLRDLPDDGPAACPVEVLDLPLVMVRDAEGRVQVFHNVCSHRGHVLVAQACRLENAIRCPYHSWAYRLDGSLRGTPFIGGPGAHELPGFDKTRHGLRAVPSAVWLGLVFVNLSATAPAFDDFTAPVRERWAPLCGAGGLEQYQPAADGYTELEVAANWKLAVENYCEAYHVPWVHPGLNSYSPLSEHYSIAEQFVFAGQGTNVYEFAERAGISLPGCEDWPADKRRQAEYLALFPNLLLGLQVDHLFAMVLEPLAHDRTRERVQLYFLRGAADGEAHAAARKTVLDGWREVFVEDVSAVEGLQRGRRSPGFEGGVFTPVMDVATHAFHRWAAAGLARGTPAAT